jgi:ribosome-associated heat shock protein Hsp15
MSSRPESPQVPASSRVRLDKWLWAARFYKTRSLAKTAIDGGKVHLNGTRAKAAKEVAVGDTLVITRGDATQTVAVTALAERRGSAAIAATLYAETEDSVNAREAVRAQRRMERAGLTVPARRPSKQDRRRLREMKTIRT